MVVHALSVIAAFYFLVFPNVLFAQSSMWSNYNIGSGQNYIVGPKPNPQWPIYPPNNLTWNNTEDGATYRFVFCASTYPDAASSSQNYTVYENDDSDYAIAYDVSYDPGNYWPTISDPRFLENGAQPNLVDGPYVAYNSWSAGVFMLPDPPFYAWSCVLVPAPYSILRDPIPTPANRPANSLVHFYVHEYIGMQLTIWARFRFTWMDGSTTNQVMGVPCQLFAGGLIQHDTWSLTDIY